MGRKSDEVMGTSDADALDAETGSYTEIMAPSADAGFTGTIEDADLASPDLDLETETLPVGDETVEAETPDDIELAKAQVEQTRAEMSQTIDAIQGRLSPENLTQQAKDTVRDATVGKVEQAVGAASDTVQQAAGNVQQAVSSAVSPATDVGSTILDTIRANPIPAALIGIGVGWLFVSSRRRTESHTYRRTYSMDRPGYLRPGYRAADYSYRSAYDYPTYDTGYTTGYTPDYARGQINPDYETRSEGQGPIGQAQDTARGAMDQAQDTARQAMSQAQDTAGSMAGQVQDTASQVAGQVQDVAGQAADQAQYMAGQAQYQARQAASSLSQLLEERPLAVGAAAIALGAAIGLALPETPQEDQWMGETRETVMDRVQQTAQETVQKVQTVAEEALGAAKQEAQEQGLAPQSSSGTSSSMSSSSSSDEPIPPSDTGI